jgi:hypothetical protein
MNSLRLSLVLGVAALLLGTVTVHAAPVPTVAPSPGPFTYTFTATNEADAAYNGSTISIYDYSLSSWDLKDGGTEFKSGSGDGSFISTQSITSFDATTWSGSFTVGGSGGSFSGDAGGGVPNFGDLGFFGDPAGVWTPTTSSVPDVGSTFQLLAAACAGLGACRQWIGRRRPAG